MNSWEKERKSDKAKANSQTLRNINQDVETLAEKVAGHNHTMSKDEKQALLVMRGFIKKLQRDSILQHAEDQQEVDRSRQLIQDCSDQTKAKLRPKRFLMKFAVGNRDQHALCRKDEGKLAQKAATICGRYHTYLSEDDKRRPPGCSCSSFNTDQDKKKIASCLELTKPWLDPLFEKYRLCKEADLRRINQTKSCNAKQAEFERSSCASTATSEVACGGQASCREMTIQARNKTHAAVSAAEVARKADIETVARILCLVDVMVAENKDKKTGLESCIKKKHDTSQFNIRYHPIPEAVPCAKDPHPPCTSWFLNQEYVEKTWHGKAPATTCTPCQPVTRR